MLEFVIATQAAVIVGLVALLCRTHAQLWRVAMSRTPGEFRAAEKTTQPAPPVQARKPLADLDEATQLVLESVSASSMPHGLGGA